MSLPPFLTLGRFHHWIEMCIVLGLSLPPTLRSLDSLELPDFAWLPSLGSRISWTYIWLGAKETKLMWA